jgi:hypothetical protein
MGGLFANLPHFSTAKAKARGPLDTAMFPNECYSTPAAAASVGVVDYSAGAG